MAENPDPADQLIEKLEILQKKQDMFAQEINQLKKEIYWIKHAEAKKTFSKQFIVTEKVSDGVQKDDSRPTEEREYSPPKAQYLQPSYRQNPNLPSEESVEESASIEKFIGENLINKIGIVITVIGVSIGVKYSIDHELISPLARIVLGYLSGLTLLFFGIRLKTKYENYSSVLVSGSMAVLYFITYAAYTYYGMLSQVAAFAVMVAITIFTVMAALKYDKMVIALIGQVGAYAIPFLLSDDSGNAVVLFSYMAIINSGILVVAVRKYWEPLYFTAFVLTWLIFVSWFNKSYLPDTDFVISLLFLGLFFILFYLTFLGYKLHQKREFGVSDIPLLMTNSAIFYGLGCIILNSQKGWEGYLGSFTILNALIHGSVSVALYFREHKDKNLFYFISGLALVFVTIAIPVQLDGNWVAMLWAGEMALLFWIGRTQKIAVYEILSYPIMVLTFLSLIHSWSVGYFNPSFEGMERTMPPLFNRYFLTTLLVTSSYGFLYLINSNEQYHSAIANREDFLSLVTIVIPSILLFTVYFAFRNEIAFYWDHLHYNAVIKATGSWNKYYTDFYCSNLLHLKTIWLINYSLFYFSILSFLNIHYLKNRSLGLVNLGLNLVVTVVFLTMGLYLLNLLGNNLVNSAALSDQHSFFNTWIRYISFGFLALILFVSQLYTRQDFLNADHRIGFDLVLFTSIICIASSELINWMNIAGSADSYKLGLSILWGIYSLLVITLGIWKKKKHLRIGAIALFAATLLKLFFYDLTDLDTISKTIVFVALGILLLIISFIYNKYKNIISD